jgi:hypothetical protein
MASSSRRTAAGSVAPTFTSSTASSTVPTTQSCRGMSLRARGGGEGRNRPSHPSASGTGDAHRRLHGNPPLFRARSGDRGRRSDRRRRPDHLLIMPTSRSIPCPSTCGVRERPRAGYVKTEMAPVNDPRFKPHWLDEPPMQAMRSRRSSGPRSSLSRKRCVELDERPGARRRRRLHALVADQTSDSSVARAPRSCSDDNASR